MFWSALLAGVAHGRLYTAPGALAHTRATVLQRPTLVYRAEVPPSSVVPQSDGKCFVRCLLLSISFLHQIVRACPLLPSRGGGAAACAAATAATAATVATAVAVRAKVAGRHARTGSLRATVGAVGRLRPPAGAVGGDAHLQRLRAERQKLIEADEANSFTQLKMIEEKQALLRAEQKEEQISMKLARVHRYLSLLKKDRTR